MERVFEQDAAATAYRKAAENFWTDVAQNRTVCIGGNSVAEHFLAAANSNRYIDNLDGPESCNTNNMLKLSEMLSDRTGDAKYADFYEQAMWNHILSTQDPTTGGYVYFTTLRPQGYRIYSQVNQAMWCCVGTGMENHSKYGHFIYTHDGNQTLYVNLFTPSELNDATFGIRQETIFPNIGSVASAASAANMSTTQLTITRGGSYAIAVRHPAWAGKDYQVKVEGDVKMAATQSIQSVKREIENLMVHGMIGGKAASALSSADFVKEIITYVAKNFNSQESVDLELTLPENLRNELEPFVNGERAKSLSNGVTAKFSGKIGGGFRITPKNGSYYIDLTSEAFEALIGEYMRPATKKMLFGE
jgi:hypothetical protein